VIDQLAAVSAKLCFWPIGFAALGTGRFKTRPALVAKDRLRSILGLALGANHRRDQPQTDWKGTQSITPLLIEGMNQTSVYYRAGLKASKAFLSLRRARLPLLGLNVTV
jgi:hypothetical protein